MPKLWSSLAHMRAHAFASDPAPVLRAPRSFASDEDRAICRAAIRTGSKSFYAASLMLPRELRDPSYALYAFCRLSDDAVDLASDTLGIGGRTEAVARLRDRLDRAYAGAPYDAAADRAFADVAHERAIPRVLPEALLEGLAWDAEGRRYETLSELRAYAARVAGAVGAMMAALMEARTEPLAARACDLGCAMQLTNIARDVGEDARAGRIYLPLEWLAQEGVDPDALIAHPQPTPALRRVVARLLAEAEALYLRAEPGIAALPRSCRPAIWSARLLYAEIGAEVARNGFDSVTQRAVVSKSRKLALAAIAAGASLAPPNRAHFPEEGPGASSGSVLFSPERAMHRLDAPTLPEMRFLVTPLVASRGPAAMRDAHARAWRWRFGERTAEAFDMLAGLHEREAAQRDPSRRA